MKNIPSYNKILTLGATYTQNALVGNIIVQEKVDGSQFRFALTDEGEIKIGSKSALINHPDESKMFKEGTEYILSIQEKIKSNFPKGTYFYGEYLQKPKHNVLKYGKVPKNHIVLFDIISNQQYVSRNELESISTLLDIDLIPELWKGDILQYMKDKNEKGYSLPLDFLKRLIETTPSFLGEETIEGVVIKNYGQTIMLGGNVFPLFTKFVRESFKERHDVEWKTNTSRKGSIDTYITSFKNEARWQKALLHLEEKGIIVKEPKDIGALIKEVQKDIIEEEAANIKEFLYKKCIDDITRTSVKGLAEWYKETLVKNIGGN